MIVRWNFGVCGPCGSATSSFGSFIFRDTNSCLFVLGMFVHSSLYMHTTCVFVMCVCAVSCWSATLLFAYVMCSNGNINMPHIGLNSTLGRKVIKGSSCLHEGYCLYWCFLFNTVISIVMKLLSSIALSLWSLFILPILVYYYLFVSICIHPCHWSNVLRISRSDIALVDAHNLPTPYLMVSPCYIQFLDMLHTFQLDLELCKSGGFSKIIICIKPYDLT